MAAPSWPRQAATSKRTSASASRSTAAEWDEAGDLIGVLLGSPTIAHLDTCVALRVGH
jgi:hypothetical protein